MSDPRFSIEDLSRLKTIDRCLAHAERRGITATRTLSGKQVLFLRELIERLSYGTQLVADCAVDPAVGAQHSTPTREEGI